MSLTEFERSSSLRIRSNRVVGSKRENASLSDIVNGLGLTRPASIALHAPPALIPSLHRDAKYQTSSVPVSIAAAARIKSTSPDQALSRAPFKFNPMASSFKTPVSSFTLPQSESRTSTLIESTPVSQPDTKRPIISEHARESVALKAAPDSPITRSPLPSAVGASLGQVTHITASRAATPLAAVVLESVLESVLNSAAVDAILAARQERRIRRADLITRVANALAGTFMKRALKHSVEQAAAAAFDDRAVVVAYWERWRLTLMNKRLRDESRREVRHRFEENVRLMGIGRGIDPDINIDTLLDVGAIDLDSSAENEGSDIASVDDDKDFLQVCEGCELCVPGLYSMAFTRRIKFRSNCGNQTSSVTVLPSMSRFLSSCLQTL